MEQKPELDAFETDNTTNISSDVPPASPTPEQSPKRHGVHPGVVVFLVFVILVLAAAVVYFALYAKQTPKETTSNSSAPVSDLTAEEVIAKIKPVMKSTVQLNAADRTYYSPPADKPSPYEFYVSPSQSSGLGIITTKTGTSLIDTDLATMKQVLSDYKFEVRDNKSTKIEDDNSVVYESDTVLCLVDHLKPFPDTTEEESASVSCANKAAYLSEAKLAEPLYKAYLADVSDRYKDVVLRESNITESQTSGYRLGEAGMSAYGTKVGGSQALFYQTPDKTWHHFANVQSGLKCSAYNTPDLKKAYFGAKCYKEDSDTESTVTL